MTGDRDIVASPMERGCRRTKIATKKTLMPCPLGATPCITLLSADTELSGPMKLRLQVELIGGAEAHLFVAVRKFNANGGMSALKAP